MAYTLGFAMLGAIILCLTYVPMMSALLLKPSKKGSWNSRLDNRLEKLGDGIMRLIYDAYRPLLKGVLRHKAITIFLLRFL